MNKEAAIENANSFIHVLTAACCPHSTRTRRILQRQAGLEAGFSREGIVKLEPCRNNVQTLFTLVYSLISLRMTSF